MTFLSKRYCIKVLFAFGATSFLMFCLAVGVGTWRLNITKDFLLSGLNARSPGYRFQSGPGFFLPPNGIIIQDMDIRFFPEKEGESQGRVLARIPTLVLRFSLKRYFFEKKIIFPVIVLKSLRGNYPDLLQVGREFGSFLPAPAGERPAFLTVKVRNARLESVNRGSSPDKGYIINAVFRQNPEQLQLEGRMCAPGFRCRLPLGLASRVLGAPDALSFLLSMDLGKDKSRIKDLMIKHPRGEGHWQGLWDGRTAQVTGYALGDTRRYDGAEGRPLKGWGIPAARWDPNLVILDMHATATVTPAEIRLDTLCFHVNTVPVRVSGGLGTTGDLPTRFSILAQSPKLERFFPGCYSLQGDIQGRVKDRRWIASGLLTVLARPPGASSREVKVALQVEGLHFKDVQRCPGVGVDALTISLPSGDVRLKGVDMFWNARLNNMDYLFFTGQLYSGRFFSRAWFRKDANGNARSFWVLDLQNLHLEDWHQDWQGLSAVSGRLSGRYFLRADPMFTMKGKMLFTDGVLNRVRFLEWFSAAFGFKAMKRLKFDALSLSMVMDPSGVHIDRLSLISDRVHIRGNFSLSAQKMVSSRLSILMDTSYVDQSLELAQLLKEKNPDRLNYNFEFQLSGPLEAVNFQWLPSRVKDLIKKRIPDFIERRIERNVDQMIKSSP